MRLASILFLLLAFQSQAQTDCDLKLDKDSIKVYTCTVPNSKFKSVKTIFELNTRLSQLAAIVMDVNSYKEWQYKMKSVTLLKKVSEREIIYHTEVEAPSLTSNRD